jgi:hypothetical protein
MKRLRRQVSDSGLHALMARDSHLWGYFKPSLHKRRKTALARAR